MAKKANSAFKLLKLSKPRTPADPNKILMYEGLPVYDAEEDLYLDPNEDDRKNGIPGDERHCVFSCCICRTTGAPEAEVGMSRTLVMARNRKYWLRYRTSLAMRQQFIAGDKMDNKFFQISDQKRRTIYTLKAFSESKRLGGGTQGTKTRPKNKDHKPKKRKSIRFKHDGGVRPIAKRLDTIYLRQAA